MKKFIENNLVGLFFSVIMLCFVIIGCLILISNKYEDDIARLEIENKKLNHELITKRKDNEMMGYAIENLQAQVDGKKAVECDCSWYEDFYYEHSAEVGAYE